LLFSRVQAEMAASPRELFFNKDSTASSTDRFKDSRRDRRPSINAEQTREEYKLRPRNGPSAVDRVKGRVSDEGKNQNKIKTRSATGARRDSGTGQKRDGAGRRQTPLQRSSKRKSKS